MTTPFPWACSEFEPRIEAFSRWLRQNGAEIYPVTSQWEVLRFLAGSNTVVIHKNKKGFLSWPQGARTAWQAFAEGRTWSGGPRKTRRKRGPDDYAALVARDGDGCLYCGRLLRAEEATIEHVVPVTAKGPNHLANKALACLPCNRRAGHLSAREKFELAFWMRNRGADRRERCGVEVEAAHA